jgi:hypothetical protein
MSMGHVTRKPEQNALLPKRRSLENTHHTHSKSVRAVASVWKAVLYLWPAGTNTAHTPTSIPPVVTRVRLTQGLASCSSTQTHPATEPNPPPAGAAPGAPPLGGHPMQADPPIATTHTLRVHELGVACGQTTAKCHATSHRFGSVRFIWPPFAWREEWVCPKPCQSAFLIPSTPSTHKDRTEPAP